MCSRIRKQASNSAARCTCTAAPLVPLAVELAGVSWVLRYSLFVLSRSTDSMPLQILTDQLRSRFLLLIAHSNVSGANPYCTPLSSAPATPPAFAPIHPCPHRRPFAQVNWSGEGIRYGTSFHAPSAKI